MKEFALTTIDNPFDPFEQFDEWLSFDNFNDHHCCSLLDRFAYVSSDMPTKLYNQTISDAIDRILELDFEGIYRKVEREVEENE